MQVDRLTKQLSQHPPSIASPETTDETAQLKDMLKQNANDFRALLGQLETLRGNLADQARLNEDLQKELAHRPTLGQMNALRVEIKHLRQQPQSNEPKSSSNADCKLVLDEICNIFDMDPADHAAVLVHFRKAK
jgi:chromosome segregation ATPase